MSIDKLQSDSQLLAGDKHLFLPNGMLNNEMMLQIMAQRGAHPDPTQQFKALIAQRLLDMGIIGARSVDLLHTIAEAAGRIAKTTETEETDSLVKLRARADNEPRPALRALYSTALGDRGLQYASQWGGRHIRRVMSDTEALTYCLTQAQIGYSMAAVALNQVRTKVPWTHGPDLLGQNLLTAQRVLYSFHKQTPKGVLIQA
ncbi:MAG: hypothetical protein ACI9QC_000669 [Oceanicoccus sp.]|jgi:hypothetical protein